MPSLTHPAVLHTLSAAEAHAILTVLWSVEHIPVGAHLNERGYVAVWPVGRALTVAEEVRALRAFCAVTDAPVRWFPAVSA